MKKGPFKKMEELMNVQGIGEKSFLKLRPQLTVTARPEPSGQH
jgi:DNA uptake protein ComE-like DNA-binding protein